MFFEDNQISEALKVYMELYEEYSQDDFLNLRIAECYFKMYDYENARFYLRNALESNPESEYIKDIYYWFGRVEHNYGNFDVASGYYEKIRKGTDHVDSLHVLNLISQNLSAVEVSKSKSDYLIENMGPEFNTEFNELYPVYAWGEDKLFLTTDRSVGENQDANPTTGLFKYSVMESFYENGKFSDLQVLDEVFSNAKNFILTSVGSGTGEYVLYKNSPEFEDGGDMYYLLLEDEFDISQPKNIGVTVNTKKLETSGALDFINEKLYFATNNNNKKGEECDVFFSLHKRANFSNSLVVNNLNTEFNEDFIYIHPGGDFVVISANNGKSVGGYDLFISVKDGKKWSEPKNMGFPFNSFENDKQFSLSPDGKYAYIASDRPGGNGRLDVYKVEFDTYFKNNFGYNPGLTIVSGQVTDDNGEEVEVTIDVSSDLKDCFNQKIETDKEGYFTFVVKPGTKYSLVIKQSSYEKYSLELDLTDSSMSRFNFNVELETKD